MSQSEMVSINILDRDYQVNCPPDEKEGLLESARTLDEKMRGIKDTNKAMGLDRIAVMAALNTTYELLKGQAQEVRANEGSSDKITRLTNKVDDALQFCRQLEI